MVHCGAACIALFVGSGCIFSSADIWYIVLVLLVGYRVDLCVCVGCSTILFYHIEVNREECYIK